MKEEERGPLLTGLDGRQSADESTPGFSSRRFSEAFGELKERRQLSYRQLAYKSGYSAGYLNHLRKGRRAPDEGTLRVVASALRVPPDYFLEYRVRQVLRQLEARPDMADGLYLRLVKNERGIQAGTLSQPDGLPENVA